MATAATARDEQVYFDGMDTPRIADIDEAAIKFRDLRDAWQKLGQEMRDAKAELLEIMHEHEEDLLTDADGNRVYRLPGESQEVALVRRDDDVKVRKIRDED